MWEKKKSCKCKYGIVPVYFFVEENGDITDIEFEEIDDKCLKKAISETILNIEKWPIAKVDGIPTRVSVKIGVNIELLKD